MTDRPTQLNPSDRPSDRINSDLPTGAEHGPTFGPTGNDSMHDTRIPASIERSSNGATNNRTGSHETATLLKFLSERDHQILSFVRDHKFVTTGHIKRVLFAGHSTPDAGTRACTRVLLRLRERRFLHRLERPVGGIRGGSAAYVWGLDVAGDRVTRSGAPNPNRVRQAEPSTTFLTHILAITELRVQLEEAAAARGFEIVGVTTEPANWRYLRLPTGEQTTLKPDLEVVTASGDYEDHWFMEVDLGTESMTALLTKCRRYRAHYDTGIEQARSGVYPIVVWLMHTAGRVRLLQQSIDADGTLPAELFRVVQSADFIDTISSDAHDPAEARREAEDILEEGHSIN